MRPGGRTSVRPHNTERKREESSGELPPYEFEWRGFNEALAAYPKQGRVSTNVVAANNPPAEWIREPAPQLRIVEDELWERVAARQKHVSMEPAALARKPKRLLSGLMRCALCDSAMTLNGGKYACSGHRGRGTCLNTKIIAAKTVERRVVEGIRAKLLAPAAVAEAVRSIGSQHKRSGGISWQTALRWSGRFWSWIVSSLARRTCT